MQSVGSPERDVVEQTEKFSRLTVFLSRLTEATEATSVWDDKGDSKSVVAMTTREPTGQDTLSMTWMDDAPTCAGARTRFSNESADG